jgi:excisionase family DNA binding protein
MTAEAKFVTVQQAAQRLKMARNTVYMWLERERLHGTKEPGWRGRWRIPESEVERIERGEGPSAVLNRR